MVDKNLTNELPKSVCTQPKGGKGVGGVKKKQVNVTVIIRYNSTTYQAEHKGCFSAAL